MDKVMKLATKKMIQRIERHKNVIAAHRDALRDAVSEVEDICESCDEAVEGLESAIENLSKYL